MTVPTRSGVVDSLAIPPSFLGKASGGSAGLLDVHTGEDTHDEFFLRGHDPREPLLDTTGSSAQATRVANHGENDPAAHVEDFLRLSLERLVGTGKVFEEAPNRRRTLERAESVQGLPHNVGREESHDRVVIPAAGTIDGLPRNVARVGGHR